MEMKWEKLKSKYSYNVKHFKKSRNCLRRKKQKGKNNDNSVDVFNL